eukprot:jgi/Ulvmu1/10027/UM059_0076.1
MLQERSWSSVMGDSESLDTLWRLPKCAPTAMLSRFEAADFIHVMTQANDPGASKQVPQHRAARPQAIILFNLPRYRLTFELRPGDKKLWCANYSGYHLPMEEDAACPLPDLPLARINVFLLLQPSQPTTPAKILLPDGTLERTQHAALCSVLTSRQADVNTLSHHAFSFNKRTLSFDTAVVHSRLFLSAIYAATHCDVPIPQLGMTGGEHALQLLRQSWVNRPLSQPEEAALKALGGFSGHTPPLRLLWQALREASGSFAFLHMQPPQDSTPDGELQRGASDMYAQAARATSPFPFVHARQQLTGDEERMIFNRLRSCMRNGSMRVAQSAQWRDVEKACLNLDSELAHVIQSGELFKELPRMLKTCGSPSMKPAATDVQISTAHLTRDAFGKEVADDLEESMRVFQECVPDLHVEQHILVHLEQELQALKERVSGAERQLATALLRAVEYAPTDEHGSTVEAFRAAGLMPRPAQADLLRITVFPATLSVCTRIFFRSCRCLS